MGEGNEWVTMLPVSFDPSPKLHEYENGGTPPVVDARKLVVRGFTPATVKLAQKAGALQPMLWAECAD